MKALNTLKHFFGVSIPSFCEKTFEISSTKRSKIAGLIFTIVLTAISIADNRQFINLSLKSKWLLFAAALIMPMIIGLAVAYRIRIKSEKFNKTWHFVFMFIMPFITITMSECLNSIFIYDMTYLGFLANYLLVLLIEFLFFALCGSFRVAYIGTNIPIYILALAHCYVVEFRGTPFIPMDFFGITTALNVGNTYKYNLLYQVLLASYIFIFILVLAIKTETPKYGLITKVVSRTFMGTFFSVLMSLFYLTSVFADAGVKPDFWNQTRGYRNYGFTFSFFCNTKYLYMSVPSGYDPAAVGDYVTDDKQHSQDTDTDLSKTPNIICIMNESLSDLSVLGNFTTSEDYMPFMRSLTENTVKGNLYVPVIGAGTSNTEFEFLTGHSTAFLPSGSNAYMLYIKNPIASLVSTLEGQGYSSQAFHPYYANGWNRTSVYDFLGFNSFTSLEDIMDISIMNDYLKNGTSPDYLQQLINQYYPDRDNMILRQYVSDEYDFNYLIEDYENRDKSVPYFMFNVTMQNHGGYATDCENFTESVFITSSQKYYKKATKYLSLVKASDDAFKGLVEYFSQVKEPTVICMFGDHQPSIETQFIAEVMGVNSLYDLPIEEEQKRHITPFIIWANFDIEEQYIDKLSSNYLSSYVLKTAGVKMTEYNEYLLSLSEKLPVIDTVGYIDAAGNHYKWSAKSEYTEILSKYEKIQYNNIFDAENRDNDVFFVEGYVPESIASEDDTQVTE